MKFDCDQCGTRYNIADEKVRRKVLKIRCRVCEHVITVRGADLDKNDPDDEAASVDTTDGWFAAPDGEEIGPMPLERLQSLVEAGEVGVDTLVWCEGMPDWIAVGAVPELVGHLPKGSSLDDEATSTFEMHDRIDDSLRRTLLSTPPPRRVRAEPSEPDRQGGIGWESEPLPDERPTVAEPSIGPLVPGSGGGGDTQRRILLAAIVLAVILLLATVAGVTWWISQPAGQRPGLPGLRPAQPAQPVQPATPAAPGAATPAQPAAPASPAAAPSAPAAAPATLDKAQVEAVIATHKADIERCRDQHVAAGPLPADAGVLSFDLRPTGRVSEPKLDEKLGGTAFATCLTEAARGWRFPVFTGDPIPVQYPFELKVK